MSSPRPSFTDDYKYVCLGINIPTLIIFIAAEIYMLKKIKFNVDTAAIFTLVIFTVIPILRNFQWIVRVAIYHKGI
jgi:hypothetical protein